MDPNEHGDCGQTVPQAYADRQPGTVIVGKCVRFGGLYAASSPVDVWNQLSLVLDQRTAPSEICGNLPPEATARRVRCQSDGKRVFIRDYQTPDSDRRYAPGPTRVQDPLPAATIRPAHPSCRSARTRHKTNTHPGKNPPGGSLRDPCPECAVDSR